MSQKNATDLKNSDGNCLILIMKQLVLLKSAMIRINSDIFSNIFAENQQTSKLPLGQNHPAALEIVDYIVKL